MLVTFALKVDPTATESNSGTIALVAMLVLLVPLVGYGAFNFYKCQSSPTRSYAMLRNSDFEHTSLAQLSEQERLHMGFDSDEEDDVVI